MVDKNHWPEECKVTEEDWYDDGKLMDNIAPFSIDTNKLGEIVRKGDLIAEPITKNGYDLLKLYIVSLDDAKIDYKDGRYVLDFYNMLTSIGGIDIKNNKFNKCYPAKGWENIKGDKLFKLILQHKITQIFSEIMKYDPKKEGEKYEKKKGEYSIESEENAQISFDDLFGTIEIEPHRFIEAIRSQKIKVLYEGSDVFYQNKEDRYESPYICLCIDENRRNKVKLKACELKGKPEELLEEIVKMFGYI